MKKKNIILSVFLMMIPLVFIIGFSSWIIMYSFEFTPNFISSPLSNYFDYSSEVIYNGQEQVPQLKSGSEITEEQILYEYKLEEADYFTEGKPKNVGNYDVKITINSSEVSGTCQVKFKILKKRIRFKETTINYSYGDLNSSNKEICSTWAVLSEELENRIIFIDEKNSEATELRNYAFDFMGMTNGVYQYGDYDLDLPTTNYIAGSTYKVEINLNSAISENYEFINGNSFTLRYKTVYVEDKLYTIDEAITMKKDLTLVGSNDRYIETCFSLILSTKEYNLNGITIKVPYNSSNKDYECIYENSANQIYSTLYIPEGITLNLNSQSNFIVGAILDASGFVEQRGVVMNNGIINLHNSNFKSYGFTKGDGLITCDDQSYVLDVFAIYDWPGADESNNLKNSNAFPVLNWSAHNISCSLRIYNGGILDSTSYIVVVSGLGKIEVKDIVIVGEVGTSKCLFKPTSSANKTEYIEKKTTIPNDSYTVSNQIHGQKDNIQIRGYYIDSNVRVEAKYAFLTYSFETNTDIAIPLRYFDLYIMEGGLEIANTSYILYDSSAKVYINTDASLTISGDAYVAARPGSYIHLNGKLAGTGSYAGEIITDAVDAIIEISNFTVTGSILKTSSTTYSTTDYVATGIILEDGNISSSAVNFTSPNLYISKKLDDVYYFEGSTEYNTYTINYVLNGNFNNGLNSIEEEIIIKEVPSFDDEYLITKSMLLSKNELFYYIDNWYIDTSFKETSIFSEVVLTNTSNEITVYAHWSEKEFSFTYLLDYEDAAGTKIQISDGYNFSNINENFTISSFINGNLTITTIASYIKDGKELDFTGWYLGEDETYKITNQLSQSVFEAYVEEFNLVTVYLYGKFTENVLYTVNLNFNLSGVSNQSIELYANQSIDLYESITSEYDKNTKERYYLYGWYFIPNPTVSSSEKYVAGMQLSEILERITVSSDNVIELHAFWVEKNYIDYYDINNNLLDNYRQWFKPNSYIILLNEEELFEASIFDPDKEENGKTYHATYTFTKLVNQDDNAIEYSAGQSVTINNKYTNLKIIYETYEYCKINIEVSNASVSINGQTYSSNDVVEIQRNVSVAVSATYTQSDVRTFTIDGSTPGSNYTFTHDCDVKASSKSSCIVSGTLITLADGTVKPIEDITYSDKVLIFNHETGQFDIGQLLFNTHENQDFISTEVLKLIFDDNSFVEIVQEHVFYDCTLNKYVEIDKDNYTEFINHEFYATDYINGEFVPKKIKFVDITFEKKEVQIFCPVTAFHMNCFANGFLIMPSMPYDITGLFNIFEYDENMQYNYELKEKDIMKYGIFTYEEFNEYIGYEISYEAYLASPAIYLKVSLGKGLTTKEMIIKCIEYLLFDNLIT